MAELVSVPYQPGYKLTPDTLALLMKACELAGHEITLSDAWRPYAEQAYYYDQYINHGGPPASNPDTGQRNHMRAAAVDITYTTAVNRAAMLAAGFTPDPDESWHFNNPNWRNMPIIKEDTSSAGGGATPIVPPKPKEKELKQALLFQDPNVKVLKPNTGQKDSPANQQPVFMRDVSNKKDFNVAGTGGQAEFWVHVYAEGTPGDILEVCLQWENQATKPNPWSKVSYHYTELMDVKSNGLIRATVTFTRRINPLDMQFIRFSTPKTNKGDIKITLVGVDTNTYELPK